MFKKLGDIILNLFSLIGTVIISIPKIPQKLRNIDRRQIQEKINTEQLKENVSHVKDKLDTNKYQRDTPPKESEIPETNSEANESSDILLISTPFTSKEKEDTIFRLQLLSSGFII